MYLFAVAWAAIKAAPVKIVHVSAEKPVGWRLLHPFRRRLAGNVSEQIETFRGFATGKPPEQLGWPLPEITYQSGTRNPTHASFDLVTTSYGLRNVPNLTAAIDEIGRVLAPGGQLLSLDFNRPSNAVVRAAYLAYLTLVGAALGWILHRDPDTYRYIPASILQYSDAAAVARLLEARGFVRATYHPILGGLMTIHHAFRS